MACGSTTTAALSGRHRPGDRCLRVAQTCSATTSTAPWRRSSDAAAILAHSWLAISRLSAPTKRCRAWSVDALPPQIGRGRPVARMGALPPCLGQPEWPPPRRHLGVRWVAIVRSVGSTRHRDPPERTSARDRVICAGSVPPAVAEARLRCAFVRAVGAQEADSPQESCSCSHRPFQ